MSAILKFQPILSSGFSKPNSSAGDPSCHILQLDEATILFDCGLPAISSAHPKGAAGNSEHEMQKTSHEDHPDSQNFNNNSKNSFGFYLDLVDKYPEIDAILLSHGDLAHAGGIPYLIEALNYKRNKASSIEQNNAGAVSRPSRRRYQNLPIIYCTFPVATMAFYSWINHRQAIYLETKECIFNYRDISMIKEQLMKEIKYSENVSFSGRLSGVSILAYQAGHSIGGTLWRLKKDTDDILYAPVFNHKRDRLLNATSLIHLSGHSSFGRPTIMITSSFNSQYTSVPLKTRDQQFVDLLLHTFRPSRSSKSKTYASDAWVLIPMDLCGRALEAAILLDQIWEYHKLYKGNDQHKSAVELLWVGEGVQPFIDHAKGMLEWCGDAILREFQQSRTNPFNFKHLKILDSYEEIYVNPETPKVILASEGSLEAGISRKILLDPRFHSKESNLLLFMNKKPSCFGDFLSIDTKIDACRSSEDTEMENLPLSYILHQKYNAIKVSKSQKRPPISVTTVKSTLVPLEGEELEVFLAKKVEQKSLEEKDRIMDLRRRKLMSAQLVGFDDEEEEDFGYDQEDLGTYKESLALTSNTDDNKSKRNQFNVLGLGGVDWILFQDRHDWYVKGERKDMDVDGYDFDSRDIFSDDNSDSEMSIDTKDPTKKSMALDDLPQDLSTILKQSSVPAAEENTNVEKTVVFPSLTEAMFSAGSANAVHHHQNYSARTIGLTGGAFKREEYGELIHPDDYKKVTYEVVDGVETVLAGEVDKNDAMQEDKETENFAVKYGKLANDFQDEVPAKLMKHTVSIEIRSKMAWFDFEGLSDGKSIKTILQHVNPKKIVIVHGDEENTKNIYEFIKGDSGLTDEVHAPRINESINVSSSTNMYRLKLTDALLSSVKFKKLNDYEVGYVNGQITFSTQSIYDGELSQNSSSMPLLDLPSIKPSSFLSHPTVIVGDIKLTDLKKILGERGLKSEFERGTLVVLDPNEKNFEDSGKRFRFPIQEDLGGPIDFQIDEQIQQEKPLESDGRKVLRIGKDPDGALILEGSYGKIFWKVRKIIYNMHARV